MPEIPEEISLFSDRYDAVRYKVCECEFHVSEKTEAQYIPYVLVCNVHVLALVGCMLVMVVMMSPTDKKDFSWGI